jgi:hypothetical protein
LASSGTETVQLSQQPSLLRQYSMPFRPLGLVDSLVLLPYQFLPMTAYETTPSCDLRWPPQNPLVRRKYLPSDFGQQDLLNNLCQTPSYGWRQVCSHKNNLICLNFQPPMLAKLLEYARLLSKAAFEL